MPNTSTSWHKYIIFYLTKHKLFFILIFILIIISSILSLSIPFSLKLIFEIISITSNINKTFIICILCIVLMIIKYSIDICYRALTAKKTSVIFKNMACDLYDHLLTLGMDFYLNTKSGLFMQSFDQDMYVILRIVMNDFQLLISSLVQILFMIVFLAYLNPVLMGICLFFIPVYYIMKKIADSSIKKANGEMLKSWGNASSNIHETLGGIKAIKELNAEEYCSRKNKTFLQQAAIAFSKLEIQTAKTFVITSMFNQLVPFLVIILGLIVYKTNGISSGSLFAFFYIVIGFFSPLGSIVILSNSIQKGKQSVKRVISYLELKSNIIENDNVKDFNCIKGSIAFEQVSFAYNDKNILDKISFSIKEGESIAIVGASGSGKTTILSLIYRLYDPNNGCVKIDNENIKNIKLEQYRKHIGYVGQETILFHASILDNLKIANNEATTNEIYEACKLVGMHKEIMGTTDGYGTIIGERGMKLSGGQRQRLSLARMILKNPSVIIFDESFSNLDSESETNFFENIKEIFKGKTRIIISHRLSSIVNTNRIIYIDNSKIIDINTHKNLAQNNINYRELWKNQVNVN